MEYFAQAIDGARLEIVVRSAAVQIEERTSDQVRHLAGDQAGFCRKFLMRIWAGL